MNVAKSGRLQPDLRNLMSRPRLLPILMVAFYYFTLCRPPLELADNRWFIVLGIAGVSFLLTGQKLELAPARIVLVVAGLTWVGGVFSLLRTQYVDTSLNALVGYAVTMATMVLFASVLKWEKARTALLIALCLAATLWSIEIIGRQITFGQAARLTYTGDADKNQVALVLSLATTTLLTQIFYMKPGRRSVLLRILFAGMIVAFTVSVLFLYSRSGMATFGVGLAVATITFVRRFRGRGIVAILVVALLLFAFPDVIIDGVFQALPYWQTAIERLAPDQLETFNRGRVSTFEKSLLLIEENPIVGIGMSAYKLTYVEVYTRHSSGTIPHNTYLGAWAETGILGVVALLVWVVTTIKLYRSHFNELSLIDKCWVLTMLPYFFMLFFLDIGSNMIMTLTVFSALYNVYRPLKTAHRTQPLSSFNKRTA